MRVFIAFLNMALFALLGCGHESAATSDPEHPVIGQRFPSVRGTGLDGTEWAIPEDLAGRPAILLIGYVMNAQFDIDRWLIGLTQIEIPVAVYELPTIEGLAPRLVAGQIDQGMRGGIPQEDWGSVITVYSDAGRITDLLGRENPRNAQVTLIDSEGVIRWFHRRGFSAGVLMELDSAARELAR